MNNLLKLCLISLLIQASLLNALHDYIEKNELFKFWDLIISVSTESINQQDYGYGCPPLHHALIINNFEFFVLLLTHPKIIHDNVDILNQTIKEKVAISPFVKSDISYAVNFVLTDSESEKKNNKIIKSKNLFLLEEKSLILWNIEHRIYDEMNLTKALINFYEFSVELQHKENTFLREDSDAITGIVDFLFNAHASKNLINEIREINFSNYLFFSEIKKKNISKCEKKIYQLLFDLKKIFSRNIEKQKTLQRLFFSLHSISTHALRGNGAIAEERILSLIFLRFINVILQKFSDEQEAQARINLIKCLQRTISGESEKGGELGLLNKFFAGTNSKGKKTQALLKELQKIFYSAL